MKLISSIFFIIVFVNLSYAQIDTLQYGKQYQLFGIIEVIEYELPSGDIYETYILKLEEPISVKRNKEWEGILSTNEIHLNRLNSRVSSFDGKRARVEGILFHALTIHHLRDACLKVGSIIIKK
ncbi:MAG: DUF4431 domain-containing protein [Saprospiraceae bacterium]